MGIIRAFSGAIGGTFADQWKDVLTAGEFDEYTVVVPAEQIRMNHGRGTNLHGSKGVLSNGSKIYVPENTAAFIFSESGIEEIITEAGGYIYQNGQASFFNRDGIGNAIFKQISDRIGFGGITADQKSVAFVNLREIRNIKFGTSGPQVYHDIYYGTDLEILSHGMFSIQITDPDRFIHNFVPANTSYYSFDDPKVKMQITSEFQQSFLAALSALSGQYRISQLPAQANVIFHAIVDDVENVGTWESRFGFRLVSAAIKKIELSETSRELINQYSATKMGMKVYEDISQDTSNIVAQQKIAQGIMEHGLGDAGGMIFGLNMAQGMSALNAGQTSQKQLSVDEQIDVLQKLKGLVEAGILTEEEFNQKKREILGISP